MVKAFLSICNHGGILIEIIDSETVKYKWFDDEWEESELHYDSEREEDYFMIGDEKYYLGEFIIL